MEKVVYDSQKREGDKRGIKSEKDEFDCCTDNDSIAIFKAMLID